MEVSQPGSLPANMARRLARRPQLAAELLRWRNGYRRGRLRWIAAAALALALALGLLAAPPAAAVLEWLAASPLVTLAISACLFGMSAVRRQERIRSDAATSWLAALPVPSSSGLRLALGAVLRLLPAAIFVGLAWVMGAAAAPVALRLGLVTAAGAAVGTAVGIPLSGGGAGATGWHYATVRRARPRWATAPSLAPLSYWPVAQGRVFSRPSASRVMLLAMLAVPAGRTDPGQVALAVAAGCVTVFTLVALSTAAARAAGDAARWLAPTAIRARVFVGAYLWRAALKQASVLAVVLLLAGAVAGPRALRVGSAIAVAYLAMSCAIVAAACARACRRVGLGAAGRGP